MELDRLMSTGWKALVAAFVIVLAVGVVKTFLKCRYGGKQEVLKAVYQTLALGLSFAAAVLLCYLAEGSVVWNVSLLAETAAIAAAVQVMYAVYENYGFRKLLIVFSKCLYRIFGQPEQDKADGE